MTQISEQEKYEKAYATGQYTTYSPGEAMLPLFRQMVRKKGGLIDFGCGCARATAQLRDEGHKALGIDFVDARETDVPFVKHDLTQPIPRRANVGYCCDVMEHIPPEDVDATLHNIIHACERVFFSIHFDEDQFGAVVGHPLHLTVKPFTWWRDKLAEFGTVKEARDLIGMGAYLVIRP